MIIEYENGRMIIRLDVFLIPEELETMVQLMASYGGLIKWHHTMEKLVKNWKYFQTPIPDSEMAEIKYETFDQRTLKVTGVVTSWVPNKGVVLWFVDKDHADKHGDSNFIRHYEYNNIPILKDLNCHPSETWPAYYFEGKKEGDVVDVDYMGVIWRLTLNQRSYRYARFGKFEDCFRHLFPKDKPAA